MQLPDPSTLERTCRSLAMLDTILMPDWQYRYYSFNSSWGAGQRMASMRNGEGDSWFISWRGSHVFLKGFDHENPSRNLSQPDASTQGPVALLLDRVPGVFAEELCEPAFMLEDTTFCRWWLAGEWHQMAEDSSQRSCAQEILRILDGNPLTYLRWAEDYYEVSLDLESVRHVFRHLPLSQALVTSLNPEANLDSIEHDIVEIGYPFAAVPTDP